MSPMFPTKDENPAGLHRRYAVHKADGSRTDPRAIYFVLRLDGFGNDLEHVVACRQAARAWAASAPPHLRQVAEELVALIDRLDGIVCRRGS